MRALKTEVILRHMESEEWQLGEIQAGIAGLQSGREIGHEKVSKWLSSWGKPWESKAPKPGTGGTANASMPCQPTE